MVSKSNKTILLEAPQKAPNPGEFVGIQAFKKVKEDNRAQLEKFLKDLSPCFLQYTLIDYEDNEDLFIAASQEISNASFKLENPENFDRMSAIFETLMSYQKKIFMKFDLANYFQNNIDVLLDETYDLLLKVLDKVEDCIEQNFKSTSQTEFNTFKTRLHSNIQQIKPQSIHDYVKLYKNFKKDYFTEASSFLVYLQQNRLFEMVRGYILEQIYVNHMAKGIDSSFLYKQLDENFKKYLEGAGNNIFSPEIYDGAYNLSVLFHIILLTDYHKDNGNDPTSHLAALMEFYNIFIFQLAEYYPDLRESLEFAINAHKDSLVRGQMAKRLKNFKEQWNMNIDPSANLVAMMALFIAFHFESPESNMDKSYGPHIRVMLMSIFRNLKDKSYEFSNSQILSCMESLIMTYSGSLEKPEILHTSVSLVFKNIKKTRINSPAEQLIHKDQVTILQYKIPAEFLKPETFIFETISSLSKNSRTITLVVSGFTSEQDIKLGEWKGFPDLFPNSDVIALNWKSNSIQHIIDKIGGISDLISEIFKNGLKTVVSGISKITEEWNITYQEAIRTGIYLAHFLDKTNIFKGYNLNLVGFSLGTLLVMSCVWELGRIGRHDIIYDVLVMGGVADINEFYKHSLEAVNNKLINCYSRTDWVLSNLLKHTNPEILPIGLGPILWPNKKVRNVDVTHVADGHIKYRPALKEVIVRTGFNEEFHSLFKSH